jgi:hypothetical protein
MHGQKTIKKIHTSYSKDAVFLSQIDFPVSYDLE